MKKKFFAPKLLLNFKLTLPLVKLVMVGARLVSNGLIFSGDTPVDILLVTLLLLYNVGELSIGEKTKNILIIIIACKIHSIQFNLLFVLQIK